MELTMTVQYVRDMDASQVFYSTVLGLKAHESSPAFTEYHLTSGHILGLWTRDLPPTSGAPTNELVVLFETRQEIDAKVVEMTTRGVNIVEPVHDVDFGYTFALADPDGHLVRMIAE